MGEEIFKVYADTRKNSNNGALWEVSNFGNVRKNGEEYLPFEMNSGYLAFGYNYKVHRAVAELFLDRIDGKSTVDHIDRDKHNNHSSNLRWATPKEQAANRDNESISKSVRKRMIGNKNALGNKYVLGRVWVFNPTAGNLVRIYPSQLPDYLSKGYIKGMKIKK